MKKARKAVLWTLTALVASGLLAATAPTAIAWQQSRGRISTDIANAPSNDVGLVLGAAVEPSGQPSPFLRGRLDVAAELFKVGKVKVVLVSGDNREKYYNEPDAMKKYLVSVGVPENKIVADYAGLDTYDSCVRANRIFGVSKLTIISQTYHLTRAVATCRLVGVDAVGVGDESARQYTSVWDYGVLREWGANIKMIWDVVSRRDPILGEPESGVTDALKRP